jgi:hypothetical protein
MTDESKDKGRWEISFGDFGKIVCVGEAEFATELFEGVLSLPCVRERAERERFQPKLTLTETQ